MLKVLIIGALVVYGIRASFNHKKYENINSELSAEYLSHKAKYKPINQKRRKDLAENKSKLQSIINSNNYTEEQKAELQLIHDTDKNIIATSQKELKEYTKVKKALLAKYKYNGWNAYYYFRLMIGPHETSFVLSLILLYVLFNPITSKIKKFLFLLFSGVFLFTSTYFILHALFAQQVFDGDFPENWYVNIMRYIPILVSITLPLLFYHYHNIETRLKNIIRMFVHVIYRDIPDNDFIKPEKEKEYRKMRIEITDKVVGNE
ncbi:MAG: SpoIIIAH-like family protein [Flavobacteriaceae bacterium]|nr:SpoIIIAH-like family protein [Flavobacteriaceae bacterium]